MAKAYFIGGGSYSRYDTAADKIDAGYPKPIANGWAGIDRTAFAGGWDSAVDLGTGKLYVFLGGEYLRIDQATNSVDSGYPRPIAGNWPGMAEAGFGDTIQAALNWGNGKAYFFRGDAYVQYDIASDSVDAGYPASIAADWPGFAETGFGDNIDAAILWDNGNAYFFKGDQYVRYVVGSGVAEGYPLRTGDYWPGFDAAGLAGHIDTAWLKLTGGGGGSSGGGGGHTAVTGLVPGDHVWFWNGNISKAQDIPRFDWFDGLNGIRLNPHDPTDYGGHGKEIHNFVVHANGMIRRGQPHMMGFAGTFAWLDNNPGNITGVHNGTNWGQYPNKFNWHSFLVFPTEEAGRDAIRRVLLEGGYPAKTKGAKQWPAGRYRDLGITEAFHRWAPAGDGNNKPDIYGAKAAQAAGVSEATAIGTLSPEQMSAVQDAVKDMEGWVPGDEWHRDDPRVPAQVRAALA
ncbi:hypothetical protein E4P42_01335 [Mycobacterium sp. PS03-16]|uniref:hemopexin repeat-containing protein n=1 Tax=Mycobacterium sp. PS03-16 TaxID=2559611 RepID=UPI0010738558|nr:hemopexin repeat-containing protein [Mycobacterium sp. PS03-16]TFV61564.1 hypothetical protein E4P42_01335 [Mycobacterium sp. PS03-16]